MSSNEATSSEASRPTVERLRDIASELFAERGYAGTSLAEIASRLGIRKPSLYNYYSSKEELFLTLFEDSLEAWRAASRPHLDGEGSCRERLRRHLYSLIDFARQEPHALALCRVAVVDRLESGLTARVHSLVNRQRADYRVRLRAFFREAVQAGEIENLEMPVLVLAWETFLDGLLSAPLLGIRDSSETVTSSPDKTLLEDLWRLFWRGLARASS